MTVFDKLIRRGYFAEADPDRGDDLPGGGTDETVDDEAKDAPKQGELDLGDEGEKKEPKEPMIPKTRFDKAVQKARDAAAAAEKRAAEAEEKLKAQTGNLDTAKIEQDLDDLEEQLEKAMADGNTEKKAQLRREIRAKNLLLADMLSSRRAAMAQAVAIEQIRYDAAVDKMEAEHPELNPDNEDTYDQDLVDEIQEYKEAFEAKGESSSVALRKALKAVYGNTPPPAKKDEEEKPAPKDDKAAERKEAAVKKALETKARQPADGKKSGLDSDKAGAKGDAGDVVKMRDSEFNQLTDEQLRKLRGDDV